MGILPGKRAWVRHYYLEKQYIGTREIFSTFALSNIFGTGVTTFKEVLKSTLLPFHFSLPHKQKFSVVDLKLIHVACELVETIPLAIVQFLATVK